jgi:hypothetical protein
MDLKMLLHKAQVISLICKATLDKEEKLRFPILKADDKLEVLLIQ